MSRLSNRRGQGLVEYILVVVLMGILTIAALNKMGKKTQEGFSTATDRLDKEFEKM